MTRAEGISLAEAVRRPRVVIADTAAGTADIMKDCFRSGACAGFILPPTVSPITLEECGCMV